MRLHKLIDEAPDRVSLAETVRDDAPRSQTLQTLAESNLAVT